MTLDLSTLFRGTRRAKLGDWGRYLDRTLTAVPPGIDVILTGPAPQQFVFWTAGGESCGWIGASDTGKMPVPHGRSGTGILPVSPSQGDAGWTPVSGCPKCELLNRRLTGW